MPSMQSSKAGGRVRPGHAVPGVLIRGGDCFERGRCVFDPGRQQKKNQMYDSTSSVQTSERFDAT
eukprot:3118820-Rhodomonas_salina.1